MGKRKLFFVFVSDAGFEVRGEKLTVDYHLVMKQRDGLVIPCWLTHELAETANPSCVRPGQGEGESLEAHSMFRF